MSWQKGDIALYHGPWPGRDGQQVVITQDVIEKDDKSGGKNDICEVMFRDKFVVMAVAHMLESIVVVEVK